MPRDEQGAGPHTVRLLARGALAGLVTEVALAAALLGLWRVLYGEGAPGARRAPCGAGAPCSAAGGWTSRPTTTQVAPGGRAPQTPATPRRSSTWRAGTFAAAGLAEAEALLRRASAGSGAVAVTAAEELAALEAERDVAPAGGGP